MNSSEYKEYLASREWAVLREKVRERSGDKCERCKVNKQDAVHHLTERIGHELLGDLQAICTPCHEFLSGKRNSDPAIE
jgi:5-methylcytosine-specific restriction endonuclease McrA